MKKTVLIMLFSVAIIGCKKEKPIDGSGENIQTDAIPEKVCDNDLVTELYNLKNDSARQDWLKQHGAELCALDLQDCILSLHDIEDAETFKKFANAHQENSTTIRYYDKTWKQIKDVIANDSCYDSYVSFDITSPTLDLKKVGLFSSEATCYSIPFFKGLEKKYKLAENDTIHFTKAIINVKIENGEKEKEKVIFKITKNGMEVGYYDLSDFPGATGPFIVSSGF